MPTVFLLPVAPPVVSVESQKDVVLHPVLHGFADLAQNLLHSDLDLEAYLRDLYIICTALERICGAFAHLVQRRVHPRNEHAHGDRQPHHVPFHESAYGRVQLPEFVDHCEWQKKAQDPDEDRVDDRVLPRVGKVLDQLAIALPCVHRGDGSAHLRKRAIQQQLPVEQILDCLILQVQYPTSSVACPEDGVDFIAGEEPGQFALEGGLPLRNLVGPEVLCIGSAFDRLPCPPLSHGIAQGSQPCQVAIDELLRFLGIINKVATHRAPVATSGEDRSPDLLCFP